ncbi:MAG: hypothetical protein CMJ40_06895 [Phycisphaerae bacterium]|nr:hypothetical protein [Phycisphaerae bacterium]|tara:strand:- start:3499 stop:4473 length:975 start_codon:yes stop_codon:yes gene_type:complete
MNKLTVFIMALLVLFTSFGLVNAASSSRDIADTELSGLVLVLQSAWFTDPSELAPLGVSNNGIVVNGSAVLQGKDQDMDSYLAATESQIVESFGQYVTKHNLNGSTAYVIMDLEAVIAPKNWGHYVGSDSDDAGDNQNGTSEFNQIITAFNLRISVAKNLLPTAKICLYGMPVPSSPHPTGAHWIQQQAGFTAAGKLGAFDLADYIVPTLYTRYCEQDSSNYTSKNATMISMALGEAQTFRRTNGESIPIMPLVTPTLFNGASACNKTNIPATELWSQITLIKSYSIDSYFMWVGNEDMPDTDQTIPEYLGDLLQAANQNSSGF